MQSFSSTSRCRRKLFNIPNDSSWPILDKPLGFRPIRPRLDHPGTPYKPQVVKSVISKPQYRVTYHSTSFYSLIVITHHFWLYGHISTVRGWSYLTTLTKYKQSINCYTSFGVIFSTYQYQLSLLVVRPHIDCPWLVVFDHFDEILPKCLLLYTIRRLFDQKVFEKSRTSKVHPR